MNIEKNLKELNKVKHHIAYILLDSLANGNSLSDTIILYNHIANTTDLETYLSENIYEFSDGYSSRPDFIDKSNFGTHIINKIISFSNNNLGNLYKNRNKENHKKDYNDFVLLIKNHISNFNIDHTETSFLIDSKSLEEINYFTSHPTSENLKKFELILENTSSDNKFITYPILSLLTHLETDDCLDILEILLNKKHITKENFTAHISSLDPDFFQHSNILLQKIKSEKYDEALEIADFMDFKFKNNIHLLANVDNVEFINKILTRENISPYEDIPFKFNGFKEGETSLQKIITNSNLIRKQEILQSFSTSNFVNDIEQENFKSNEFFNLIKYGEKNKDLKNFISTRDIKFDSLLSNQNLDFVSAIKNHHNWWLIPLFVEAENKMIKDGKNVPGFFASFLHNSNDSKYLNQLVSNLKKTINLECLNLQFDSCRTYLNQSLEKHNFSSHSSLFKKSHHGYQDSSNNIYPMIMSQYDKNKVMKDFNLAYSESVCISFSLYGSEHTNNEAYFNVMYTIKEGSQHKNDYLFKTDCMKSSYFFDPDNNFYIHDMHMVLTDYFVGNQIFSVSEDKRLAMENKILDIVSDFMYNIYKDDFENRNNYLKQAVSVVDYVISTLEKHTKNLDKLNTIMLKDSFVDKFFTFTEVLKSYNLPPPQLQIQKKLTEKSLELYEQNLEINMPTNIKTKNTLKF